jgi:RNA polymerase sigma factor (TIGR02999 family)
MEWRRNTTEIVTSDRAFLNYLFHHIASVAYTNPKCLQRGLNPDTGSRPVLTALLNRMQRGDREAGNRAAELVYGELRAIAARQMKRDRDGHALQTTALVHEAYMKLACGSSLEIESRGHFYALASRQMRRVLVDYARSARVRKRGGNMLHDDLESVQIGVEGRTVDLILLNEALTELESLEPRAAQVVELRVFGGYTDKEIVEALGISLATVRRDWEYARSWLFARMQVGAKTK